MSDPALSGAPRSAPEPVTAPGETGIFNPPPGREAPSAAQLWLHRISVFLFVLISAVTGVLLIILPWTDQWTDNYLFLSLPSLRTIVTNGFFKGVCSGLGLLDIWIGFWEALHYHEMQQ